MHPVQDMHRPNPNDASVLLLREYARLSLVLGSWDCRPGHTGSTVARPRLEPGTLFRSPHQHLRQLGAASRQVDSGFPPLVYQVAAPRSDCGVCSYKLGGAGNVGGFFGHKQDGAKRWCHGESKLLPTQPLHASGGQRPVAVTLTTHRGPRAEAGSTSATDAGPATAVTAPRWEARDWALGEASTHGR